MLYLVTNHVTWLTKRKRTPLHGIQTSASVTAVERVALAAVEVTTRANKGTLHISTKSGIYLAVVYGDRWTETGSCKMGAGCISILVIESS